MKNPKFIRGDAKWHPETSAILKKYQNLKVIYDPPLATSNVYLVKDKLLKKVSASCGINTPEFDRKGDSERLSCVLKDEEECRARVYYSLGSGALEHSATLRILRN